MTNLYNEYRAEYRKEPDFTINFYKNNSIYLDNLKSFKNQEELRLFIELIWQYLNALYAVGHYDDVVSFFPKKRLLIDQEISKFECDNLKDIWYFDLLNFYGMASCRIKNYKTSSAIFQELVNYDNKNNLYKNWLYNSKYSENSWIMKTMIVVSFTLMGGQFLSDMIIKTNAFNGALINLGMIGLVLSFFFDLYQKKRYRI